MRSRRLAVLSYHSSPLVEPGSGDAGGMTVYIRELAAALAEQGVTTDIFTRADSSAKRVTEIGEGIRVISIEAGPRRPIEKDSLRHHIAEFASGVQAFAIVERRRYDLIHSHYWQSGLAAKILATSWGVPLVHSHHTLGRVKNRWLAPGDRPESAARLTGEQDLVESADVLVASTADEWRQLARLYQAPADRLKILYPGVDHLRFQPGPRAEARRALGLSEAPLLLAVGRIQPLKGLDLAIEALGRIGDPEATLVIVGGASGPSGGAELERLEARARDHGIADRVRFVGQQPHDRLPLYYQAADLLLVCSHSESFGLVALEAQACGLPVIGTSVGGLPDLVGDGTSGLLVDDRDPAVFARRIGEVLDDRSLRDAFSAASRERALRFSWKKTAEGFLDLYECLIREDFPEACTC